MDYKGCPVCGSDMYEGSCPACLEYEREYNNQMPASDPEEYDNLSGVEFLNESSGL